MKVGSAVEAILLSLALAGRINALRREREEAQRELLRAKIARLEAVSTLVSGVAHEIGNPLNFARGGAEELARRLEAGDLPAARRASALALSGMNRIERILANLRSYLRTGDVAEVPTDIGQEISAALDLVADRMSSIRVERRIGELPPVRARPGEIHQVLVNLITNAVQAMPRGGELVIEAAARGGAVEIAVEDTGPGVDPALRDAIFEPFFTTRGEGGGTGLGLGVAREIVLRHGGSIRVEDGRVGARFVVSLPTAR
jgi:signal transduction histidine kinase